MEEESEERVENKLIVDYEQYQSFAMSGLIIEDFPSDPKNYQQLYPICILEYFPLDFIISNSIQYTLETGCEVSFKLDYETREMIDATYIGTKYGMNFIITDKMAQEHPKISVFHTHSVKQCPFFNLDDIYNFFNFEFIHEIVVTSPFTNIIYILNKEWVSPQKKRDIIQYSSSFVDDLVKDFSMYHYLIKDGEQYHFRYTKKGKQHLYQMNEKMSVYCQGITRKYTNFEKFINYYYTKN